MRGLYRRAAKVAQGDIPVLILGESGAGKEVLARWVHARSPRAELPFLTLNCAALPRDLLEAEIFGIEKGVATGVDRRAGILEQAAGGTILLDEIGDMALETQAKLLRVLEGKRFFRVGGHSEVAVDVRFLAATNRPLDDLADSGAFRSDLYHRLAAFVVSLPPLRARAEDIPLLAAHFFQRECSRSGRRSPGMTRAALGALVAHSWPGNIRQLENEIAKAVLLLDDGEPLDVAHLSRAIRKGGGSGSSPQPLSLATATADAQRQAIRLALAAADGDPARAIAILGISRATYYRKLKEFGIES
jgi:DNA-binding NtrC family response regulator